MPESYAYKHEYALTEESRRAIEDGVNIAFGDIDYSPIPDELIEESGVISGSERIKYSYDPSVNDVVHVVDLLALSDECETQASPTRRLLIFWGDDEGFEVELDEGLLLSDSDTEDVEVAKTRILGLLASVTDL